MAGDRKKRINVCAKVTEKMFVDLNRLAILSDLSLSSFVFTVLRQKLYGEIVRINASDDDLQD